MPYSLSHVVWQSLHSRKTRSLARTPSPSTSSDEKNLPNCLTVGGVLPREKFSLGALSDLKCSQDRAEGDASLSVPTCFLLLMTMTHTRLGAQKVLSDWGTVVTRLSLESGQDSESSSLGPAFNKPNLGAIQSCLLSRVENLWPCWICQQYGRS